MPVPQYACSANPTAEGSEVARPQAGIPKESAGRSKKHSKCEAIPASKDACAEGNEARGHGYTR